MMGVYDVLMNVMMKSRHLLSSSFIVDDIMADYFLQTETQIRLFNIIETKCKNLTTDFWNHWWHLREMVYLFFGTNLPT